MLARTAIERYTREVIRARETYFAEQTRRPRRPTEPCIYCDHPTAAVSGICVKCRRKGRANCGCGL